MAVSEVTAAVTGTQSIGPTPESITTVANCVPGDAIVVACCNTINNDGGVFAISSPQDIAWTQVDGEGGGTKPWAQAVGIVNHTGSVEVFVSLSIEKSTPWAVYHLRDSGGTCQVGPYESNTVPTNSGTHQLAPSGLAVTADDFAVSSATHSGNTNGITPDIGSNTVVLVQVTQVIFSLSGYVGTTYSGYASASNRASSGCCMVVQPAGGPPPGPPPVHALSGFGHPLSRPGLGSKETFHPIQQS